MNPNMLTIKVANSAEEAPNYNELNAQSPSAGYAAADLKEAVIVRNGTEDGNDTVDLIFEDSQGQLYVAAITARLLKTVTDNTRVKG